MPSHLIGSLRCYGVSIRDLIAALALGTIVYRWAIADNTESRSDDTHVGLLERLYRLRQLMAGTW